MRDQNKQGGACSIRSSCRLWKPSCRRSHAGPRLGKDQKKHAGLGARLAKLVLLMVLLMLVLLMLLRCFRAEGLLLFRVAAVFQAKGLLLFSEPRGCCCFQAEPRLLFSEPSRRLLLLALLLVLLLVLVLLSSSRRARGTSLNRSHGPPLQPSKFLSCHTTPRSPVKIKQKQTTSCKTAAARGHV